jgi:(1->4)-alpha-D-glucan 1-alpha-D-glucosylmutase
VEKILEPGERLRDWPVEGTTGYEFANDVTALFVDPAGEQPLSEVYAELTGERRGFADVAFEAKLEQARTDFRRDFSYLRRLLDHAELERAAAALPVYRTYVEPWSGKVSAEDRDTLAALPDDLRRILLLEERGHDELVVRFQQITGAVMAKGVEDTAFYRFVRLASLNEVGGDPGRFSLPVDEFHRANLERAERFPLHLLTSQTHDTKRSGDVRARIGALAARPGEWRERVLRWRELTGGLDDPNEEYLLWQTLVGAWPIGPDRLERYMEKALREAKTSTSWVEPDYRHERRVRELVRSLHANARFRVDLESFVEALAADARRAQLGALLLRLTAPGVPDLYQGDELEALNLVDPDNRRPVDWERRRRALAAAPGPETAKLHLIRTALALRRRRPAAFLGAYVPVEAGQDVCAYRRGADVLVSVPLRAAASFDPGGGWRELLPEYDVGLFERSR